MLCAMRVASPLQHDKRCQQWSSCRAANHKPREEQPPPPPTYPPTPDHLIHLTTFQSASRYSTPSPHSPTVSHNCLLLPLVDSPPTPPPCCLSTLKCPHYPRPSFRRHHSNCTPRTGSAQRCYYYYYYYCRHYNFHHSDAEPVIILPRASFSPGAKSKVLRCQSGTPPRPHIDVAVVAAAGAFFHCANFEMSEWLRMCVFPTADGSKDDP